MSEQKFLQLMSTVKDFAIIFKDANAIITEWNVGAENLFGWTREEAVGKSILIIYTPDDIQNHVSENEMTTAATTGSASDDRWHVRKDGTYFFSSGLLHPTYEDGKLTGFVKIVRDLTQQVELEEDIQEARNALELEVQQKTTEIGEISKVLKMEMSRQRRNDFLRLRLLERIVETQEDERKRISRDVHDHLGQELTALRLRVQLIESLFGSDPKIAEHIKQLKELTETVDNTVDFLAWELRPNAVNEVGLETSLNNFVNEWSRQFSIPAEFKTVMAPNGRLAPLIEVNLYRIAQESLNNVAKHAAATSVNVILEKRQNEVTLVIEDDGKGFDVDRVSEKAQSLGLVGMGERAAILKGRVEIESTVGKGTTVHVCVPAAIDIQPDPDMALKE